MMAMKHTRFDELQIGEAWRGAMCEDLQLTKVVRQAGGSVFAPRELLLRTRVGTTGFAEIAHQARRWYMLIRIHMPVTYALATAVPTLNAAGWLLVIFAALTGATGAAVMLLAAMGFAVLRTAARAAIVARLWGKPGLAGEFLVSAVRSAPHPSCGNHKRRIGLVDAVHAPDDLVWGHL